MDLHLTGKKALITGSTAGIGLAIATQLCREGAHVIVNGRTSDRVDTAVSTIEDMNLPGEVSGVVCDFGVQDQIAQLLTDAGEVDILVNNVGIFEPRAFVDISDDEWYKLFEINVMSGVRLARHFFPGMIKRNWGRIVFIASESGVQIPEEMVHYGMTKSAQIAIANGLARATKKTGVTVNSILPGSTWSEGAENFIVAMARENNMSTKEFEAQFFRENRPGSLLQRFASTEEVANMVTYICSPLASATNGAALRVDGGTIPTML